MECSFALVADAANASESGKLNVLGIFSQVNPPAYPYIHPAMYVIANLTAGPAEFGKQKDFEIAFIDPDGRVLSRVKTSGKVPQPDLGGSTATMQIVFQMVNTPFPKPGPYAFDILVADDRKGRIPLEAAPAAKPTRRKKGNGRKK